MIKGSSLGYTRSPMALKYILEELGYSTSALESNGKLCYATTDVVNNNANFEPNALGDVCVVYSGETPTKVFINKTYTGATAHTWEEVSLL